MHYVRGRTKINRSNQISMDQSKELSELDKYHLAKYYPGAYNPDAIYIDKDTMVKSSAISSAISISGAPNTAGGSPPLGTETYCVIMWCPVLTATLDVIGTSPTVGQQRSGFVVGQTSIPNTSITFNAFDNIWAGGIANSSPSMLNTFQLDSTPELMLAVWASRIKLNFVTPAANLVGTYYQGRISIGSFEASTFSSGTPITVQKLINNASHVHSHKPYIELSSSVINPLIFANIGAQTTAYFDGESIDYVVLQTPAMSITTGLPATYSLMGEVHSNIAVYPSMNNVFLFKSFQPKRFGVGTSVMSFVPTAALTDVEEKFKPPTTKTAVNAFVKKLEEEGEVIENTPVEDNSEPMQLVSHVHLMRRAMEEFADLDTSSSSLLTKGQSHTKARVVKNLTIKGVHIVVKADPSKGKHKQKKNKKNNKKREKAEEEKKDEHAPAPSVQPSANGITQLSRQIGKLGTKLMKQVRRRGRSAPGRNAQAPGRRAK